MGRVVKPEAYQARRNEILDVAQRLVVVTKGYTGMAVQDILDELQISKGAFYHYFDSKQVLLEALIERLASEATPMLTKIVDDPDLPALEKLRSFFEKIARWKTDRREYLLALLDVWYADENAIVREKLRAAMPERYGPLFAQVIRQGIAEGVMSSSHPELVCGVILSMLYDLGYDFAALLRQRETDREALERVSQTVAAYSDAIERVLGAPHGSLTLIDSETIHAWFDPVIVPAHPPPA
ncbi:MAG TPA: TetR/AcrR family transcriptional regulator [Anaerolineales bacterium]|jgi:AcrR family transcriptional regulator|nr:TetR/AcrR family transcriptional regulator [Anaerolineales bacterium]